MLLSWKATLKKISLLHIRSIDFIFIYTLSRFVLFAQATGVKWVKKVAEGGMSHGKLRVGQQMIAANNITLHPLSHRDAIDALKGDASIMSHLTPGQAHDVPCSALYQTSELSPHAQWHVLGWRVAIS
jgi:hypothetical protein